ncbi:hypothetical protein BOX15_Mlig014691g1, partial [Macrostomum lignano]
PGYKPLAWTVPDKPQALYQLCNCKYTKSPPLCDGSHTNLPCQLMAKQADCNDKSNHAQDLTLCSSCGWCPKFQF